MSDCPFRADTTIEDPRFFVGRQEQLKMLSERMQGSQPTSINVVGKRRTGKSSLLVHFQQTYQQRVAEPERYRVISLSLFDASMSTEEKFYTAIAKQISKDNAAQRQNPISSLLNAWKRDDTPIQDKFVFSREEFSEFIKDFKGKGILPVLCIDNFEKLLKRPDIFPNGFYDNLRYLVDSNYLMLVMASPREINTYINEKKFTSVFFNLFQTMNLDTGLTASEAEMLVSLQNATGEGLSEDHKGVALKWAKTDPYLLQYAGEQLWAVKRRQKSWRDAEKRFKAEADRLRKSKASQLKYSLEQKQSNFVDICKRCWGWLVTNPDKALKLMLVFAIPIVLILLILGVFPIEKASEIIKLIQGK